MSEEKLGDKENVVFSSRFHFCTIESLRTYFRLLRDDGNDTQVNLVIDFDNYMIHLSPGYKFHRQISVDADLNSNSGAYSFVKTDKIPLFIYRHGKRLENKEREVVIRLIKDILELE